MPKEKLVEIKNLSHLFRLSKSSIIKAVNNVSLDIVKGEILGLVGESGSGKSTLARCIMNIYQPTEGEMFFKGINLCDKKQLREHKKKLQKERQIIFQDSNSSLNQRMSVRSILAEPLKINRMYRNPKELEAYLKWNLDYVGLEHRFLDLYPPEISGFISSALAMLTLCR